MLELTESGRTALKEFLLSNLKFSLRAYPNFVNAWQEKLIEENGELHLFLSGNETSTGKVETTFFWMHEVQEMKSTVNLRYDPETNKSYFVEE